MIIIQQKITLHILLSDFEDTEAIIIVVNLIFKIVTSRLDVLISLQGVGQLSRDNETFFDYIR